MIIKNILLLQKICISTTSRYRINLQNKVKHDKYIYNTVSSIYNQNEQQEQYDETNEYKQQEMEVNINSTSAIEIDMPQCPQSCVCQYAHLNDFPISRWINLMQKKYLYVQQSEENEVYELSHERANNFLLNPLIKQATCIIQEDTNSEQLIKNLPNDVQALILLYTGAGKNKTGNKLDIINSF